MCCEWIRKTVMDCHCAPQQPQRPNAAAATPQQHREFAIPAHETPTRPLQVKSLTVCTHTRSTRVRTTQRPARLAPRGPWESGVHGTTHAIRRGASSTGRAPADAAAPTRGKTTVLSSCHRGKCGGDAASARRPRAASAFEQDGLLAQHGLRESSPLSSLRLLHSGRQTHPAKVEGLVDIPGGEDWEESVDGAGRSAKRCRSPPYLWRDRGCLSCAGRTVAAMGALPVPTDHSHYC